MSQAQFRPIMLAVLVSSIALAGCNRGYKPDIPKPSPLPTLPAQTQTLKPIWSERMGGANKHDPLRLQLAFDAQRYVAANRKGELEAWDTQGRSLWSRDFKDAELSSGVTLSDERVVVGSATGQLMVLDAKTGQTLWTRQLSASMLAPALVAGDRVVALANDGTVTGTSLSTGQPVWTFDIQVPAVSIRGNAAPILYDATTVILASAGGRLYAVDLNTGMPKWERRVAISQGRSEVQRLIDVDGDSRLDLVLGGHEWENAPTQYYTNPGDFMFGSVTPVTIPAVANEGVVLDFTVTGSDANRTLWVLRTSGGDGTFYQSRVVQKVNVQTLNSTLALNQRPQTWIPWIIPSVASNSRNVITSDNLADQLEITQ